MPIQEIQEHELDERQPIIEEVNQSDLDEGPSFKESLMREAPKVIGGILGGVAGAPAGPVGVAAGITGGAMIGETLEQMREHAVGDPNAPKTSAEAAERIGMGALKETAADISGQKVIQGVGKILAPFSKTVTKEATDVMNYFADRIKPVLLPAEATDSRVLDILQNVSEASLIGGNKISQFKYARDKVFDEYAEEIINTFGEQVGPDELGDLFVTALNNKKAWWKTITDPLYDAVDELAEGVTVPSTKLKKFAKPIQEIAEEIGSVESKNAGDDLIKTILELDDTLSFTAATELRSRLLSRVNEFSVLNPKAPAVGKAKKLIGLLDESIESALKEQNSEALKAWRYANETYKKGQQKFNNVFLRKMIKMGEDSGIGSEFIAERVFKPKAVNQVKKVKTALGKNSPEWEKMKGFFTNNLLKKSTTTDGIIDGKKLLNNMSGKPGSYGDEMLGEIYTTEQKKALQMFGEALKTTQSRQGAGEGRMFIQLAQFGAIVGLGAGITTGDLAAGLGSGAGTIVFGPTILSRIMTNPKTAKLLTRGIKLPAGSKELGGIMARLARVVTEETIELQEGKTPEVIY